MSYSVSGTMITLTRGDTFTALITITDSEGNQYVPVKGDRIRFAMKTDYEDGAPLLIKEIPIDTMILVIEPEDTSRDYAHCLANYPVKAVYLVNYLL